MKNIIKYLLILSMLVPIFGYSQIKFPVKKKSEKRVNKELMEL